MTLQLRLALEAPPTPPTPFEGARLRVELSNQHGPAVQVPGLDDPSGPLLLTAATPDGTVARRMSTTTQHLLVSTGRPAVTPMFLRPLPPGGRLEAVIDTGTWHLPLPAGSYRVTGRFRFRAIDVTSNEVAVRVEDAALMALEEVHDDAVTEMLTLLLTARDEAGRTGRTLRALGAGRPPGAWHSNGVLEDLAAERRPFVSAASSFQTDSFGPAFSRWLVWAADGQVQARRHERGARAEDRSAPLPAGHELLRWAWVDLDRTLRLFTRGPGGPVVCHALGQGRLERPVQLQPPERDLEVAAAGAGGGAALVMWRQGEDLHLHRVDLSDGQVRERRPLITGRGRRLHGLRFGLQLRELQACLLSPDRRSAELVAASLEDGDARRATLEPEAWKERPPRELAFHVHRTRFHAAWSDGAALWHGSAAGDVLKLADGPGPFFPSVIVGVRAFVGFAQPGRGHRFVELDRGGAAATDFERLGLD